MTYAYAAPFPEGSCSPMIISTPRTLTEVDLVAIKVECDHLCSRIKNVEGMEAKLDVVWAMVEDLGKRVEGHAHRMDCEENDVNDLRATVDALKVRTGAVEARLREMPRAELPAVLMAKPAPLDEAAIRANEREKWRQVFCDDADEHRRAEKQFASEGDYGGARDSAMAKEVLEAAAWRLQENDPK